MGLLRYASSDNVVPVIARAFMPAAISSYRKEWHTTLTETIQ